MKGIAILIALLLIFTVGCGKKAEQEQFAGESTELTGEAEVATGEEGLEEGVPTQEAIFVKPTVKEIQQALTNAGLYEGEIDGVSGPKTKQAIEDFQAQNNLAVDGRVGPKTWEKLEVFFNQAE